ncbi:MAG: DUF5060 domain-containing protein, partial [Planctomycetota bacterium]
MKFSSLLLYATSLLLGTDAMAASPWEWETVAATGQPTARHEAGLVAFEGRVLLIGGRRINPVDVFDPTTNTWTAKSSTPLELHHFQAVVVDDAVYLMGAMTGKWPREKPLERIVVYYPNRDEFKFVHSIPPSRQRGGAGAVLHDGKIYLVGGITNGHMDGYQAWLDRYDPQTGQWDVLPDAPHARDHFQAVVYDNKLYALAGRTSSQATNQGFDLTVEAVDVFDLDSQTWLPTDECPQLPTLRAGNMAMVWGGELLVGGGESATQKTAHNEVEAFDTSSHRWRRWPSLQRGRHGSGFAVVGDYVYTASGSGNRGGGPELTSIERLRLPSLDQSINQVTAIRSGEPLELSFHGPDTSESATPNPFTDYRLDVEFQHADTTISLRGFYAADGDAAETGSDRGNVWKVRFRPQQLGTWSYTAKLRAGADVAISDDELAGQHVQLSPSSGQFEVSESEPDGEGTRDFYRHGSLVTDHGYFRLGADGPRWMKGGCDSPENLLGYVDFDDTYRIRAEARKGEAAAPESIHRYQPHARDWTPGDPTWRGGKGKSLIGGINYLSRMGVNGLYFLTMNIGGDGKDVWPYTAPDDFTRFDCSKLDQWNVVFQHMQRKGVALHVVTQETENERLLDDGDTGRLRKLYYRELISRFAHHPALIWNLGEENGPADFSPNGQTNEQQRSMATYLKESDPYGHPVLIHTHSTAKGKEEVVTGLLGHVPLDGLSFQVNSPERVHEEILHWRQRSIQAGHPWLISMDEIGKWDTGAVPDSLDPGHDGLRSRVLWGSLMAGAAGVEWYFGAKYPHNDLTSEDWRQRENLWRQTTIARRFFDHHLPYWEMQPADQLTDCESDYCFAKPGQVYSIYLPPGQSTR